jgi:hypothetical protein
MVLVKDNPDYDPMEIIQAELEWVDSEVSEGTLMEINSEHLVMYIEPQGDLADKYPWRLGVYKNSKLIGERECVDLAHAEHLAEAFEITAIRDHKRGCTWHGKPL